MDNFAFIELNYTNGEKKMIPVAKNHGVNAVAASHFASDSTIGVIAYRYNDFEYSNSHSAVNAMRRELKFYGITCRTREMDGVLYFLRDFRGTTSLL